MSYFIDDAIKIHNQLSAKGITNLDDKERQEIEIANKIIELSTKRDENWKDAIGSLKEWKEGQEELYELCKQAGHKEGAKR